MFTKIVNTFSLVLVDPLNSRFSSPQKVLTCIASAVSCIFSLGSLTALGILWRWHISEKNETHEVITHLFWKMLGKINEAEVEDIKPNLHETNLHQPNILQPNLHQPNLPLVKFSERASSSSDNKSLGDFSQFPYELFGEINLGIEDACQLALSNIFLLKIIPLFQIKKIIQHAEFLNGIVLSLSKGHFKIIKTNNDPDWLFTDSNKLQFVIYQFNIDYWKKVVTDLENNLQATSTSSCECYSSYEKVSS